MALSCPLPILWRLPISLGLNQMVLYCSLLFLRSCWFILCILCCGFIRSGRYWVLALLSICRSVRPSINARTTDNNYRYDIIFGPGFSLCFQTFELNPSRCQLSACLFLFQNLSKATSIPCPKEQQNTDLRLCERCKVHINTIFSSFENRWIL